MNKLFTKIASLTIGLALVASAGAFLGNRSAKSANASDAVAASCDFTTQSASCTGYSKEHTYGDYLVYGGQNYSGGWNYFKFGAKKANKSDPAKVTEAYIKGTTALSNDITKVELVLLTSSYNDVTVTWTLDYSDDASFATKTTIDKGSLTYKVAGSYFVQPASGTFGTNKYYCLNFHIENNTTTNGVLFISKVNFIYESAVSRGDLSIGGLSSNILFKDDSNSLTAAWDPLDSGATLDTHEFKSSNTDVLSFSGDTYTAVGPGKARITLTGTDSNLEEYSATADVYVSNEYSFEVGDNVALFSSGALMELSGIDKSGTTHYGTGVAYTTDPNGVYLLNVEQGTANGSLSFKNGDDYLSWSSGNSLTTKTDKDDNSSWYVVSYDDYELIINASTLTREIWWNSGNPRFACYEGKTPTTTGYNAVSLMKIEDAPVRGTISIANEFGSTMRQNATDSLSYNWTPAEASEATIVSHTWSSTNSDAIAISGDTYTAVAPGKAKISLAATDSNGQEYLVSTSEITVIETVSGSLVKYYSVSSGDVVTIVCEADGTQMSGISSKIGSYVFYDSNPAGSIYDFEVVEVDEYFALKTSDDKYLNWVSGTDISLEDDYSSDNSQWSISFNEGNALISNKALDGEDHRYIAWNHNSPRFTTYKSGQTAVQLYGPELELSANAIDFINNLNSLTCDDSGDTAPDVDAWKDLKDQYESVANPLSSQDKATISTIKAVEHASPVTVKEQTEAAMAKYDYIVAKYNLGQHLSEEYPDFIGRDPDPLRNITEPIVISNNTNSAIIAVTVIALTSVSAIAVLLIVKRRKTY